MPQVNLVPLLWGLTAAYDMIPCPGASGSAIGTAESSISDPDNAQPGDCICVPSTQYNYTCPAGSFCPTATSQFNCTDGYFCPANVSQPAFCCKGFYCPTAAEMKICPSGSFCPPGVIEPITCPPLTTCEEGTGEIRPLGPIVAIFVLFIVLFIGKSLQGYYNEYSDSRKEKHVREFAQTAELLDEDEHDRNTIIRQKSLVSESKLGGSAMTEEKKEQKDGKDEGVPTIEDTKDDFRTVTTAAGPDEPTFDIRYEDLWLTLRNGRTIMKGVSGKIRKGRTTAIMGPSGAGKSTLINLIMGKAKRSKGKIFINDKEDELWHYSKLVGFVPQEDVMLNTLTVYDIIRFSADYRLPSALNHLERRKLSLETLKFLEIDHVINSIIGTAKRRGISGGQRKRVNIGMELTANPKVLFLDEPTSGLDAVTSLTLAKLLKKLARTNDMPVAAIIHSPSADTFNQFDDFTLLGAGGQMIYTGPTDRCAEYMESIGFKLPEDENPADFFIEVSMGKIQQILDPEVLLGVDKKVSVEKKETKAVAFGPRFNPKELFPLWISKGAPFRPEKLKELSDPDKADAAPEHQTEHQLPKWREEMNHFGESYKEYWIEVWEEFYQWVRTFGGSQERVIRQTPNDFFVYFICFRRTYIQIYRDGSWVYGLFLHAGLGLFLSVMGTTPFVGPLPNRACESGPTALLQSCVLPLENNFLNIGVFASWAISFAGMTEGILTFGPEQVVFWRHASHELNTIPYFLAKISLDLPRMVLDSLLFWFGIRAGYVSLGSQTDFFGFIFMNYWVGYSMGYFLSMVAEPRNRSLYAVIFAMMWTLIFSGVVVSLPNVEEEYTKGLSWIWDVSPTRWGTEAFYVNEIKYYDYLNIGPDLDLKDYKTGNIGKAFGAMFGIGLFWQFITFLLIKLLNRDKRK
ncbi:hypothetical protein AAMO2058_000819800 [Amorphochlora amoebiformis]